MEDSKYAAYLKEQPDAYLVIMSRSIDKESQAHRYEMIMAEKTEREKRGEGLKPVQNPTRFASCASQVDSLQAVFLLILAAAALVRPYGWIAALALVVRAIVLCKRARRRSGGPYVEVLDGSLIVHAGLTIRRVDILSLAGVRSGLNKTILILKDGTNVAIDHSGFATGEEATRFRRFVEETSRIKEA